MTNDNKNEAGGVSGPAENPISVKAQIHRLIDRYDTNTKAYASVVFGGSYALHGVKVVAGQKGDFVSLPSYKGADGKYYEYFHPVTAAARSGLNSAVMDAYRVELGQTQGSYGHTEGQDGVDHMERQDGSEAGPGPAEESQSFAQ